MFVTEREETTSAISGVCVTEREETAIATIIVRGATDNIMDDIERAIDDGVNTFKSLTKVHTCATCS